MNLLLGEVSNKGLIIYNILFVFKERREFKLYKLLNFFNDNIFLVVCLIIISNYG